MRRTGWKLMAMAALGGAVAMVILAAGRSLLVDQPARAQDRTIDPANVRDPVFQLTRLQMELFELRSDNDRLAGRAPAARSAR